MIAMDWLYATGVIVGLTACTIVTRGLFIIPKRSLPLPERVKTALRYAPIAALVGVIAPEILLPTLLGAAWVKVGGAAAAALYFYARRDILGTILTGMAAYALLRFALAPLIAPYLS